MSKGSLSGGSLSSGGGGGLCPAEEGLCLEGDPLSHVNRMTDASKNIILPKTSLASGNKAKAVGLSVGMTGMSLISSGWLTGTVGDNFWWSRLNFRNTIIK